MDKKTWFKVLHYGSLWGIAEVVLGYALHTIPFFASIKIAGSIMFPIGVLCMYSAYKKTNKTQVILLTALVAAAIKPINFLMPYNIIADVVNPVMAIVAEGLCVLLIMPAILNKSSRFITLFGMGFAVSATWRVPFLYIPYTMGWTGMWEKPAERWIPFLTTDVFFSALFIGLFLMLAVRFPLQEKATRIYEKIAFAPAGVFALLASAIALEYIIQ